MTTKYECDRCHRQTTDRDALLEVTWRRKDEFLGADVVESGTYHYCSFCSLMMCNAFGIVNNGTYAGSLRTGDKIGDYNEDLKKADPFFNKDLELKE